MKTLAAAVMAICLMATQGASQLSRASVPVGATSIVLRGSAQQAQAARPIVAPPLPPLCCRRQRLSPSLVRFMKVGAYIGGAAGFVEGIRVMHQRCDNCDLAEPVGDALRRMAPILLALGGAGAGAVLGAGVYGGYRLVRGAVRR